MKIKWKTTKNEFPRITATINTLNNKKIQVGVFDGEHAWLAGIHEYGCDIKAKNTTYLTVPVSPKAKNKKASDFPNIFCITSKNGNKLLAIPKGKNDMEILFWLTEKIHIPERSFLRSGHDECIKNVIKKADMLLNQLLNKKMSEETFLNMIGQILATQIKAYATNLSSPTNSSVTSNVKGSSNPLNDTGNLINSITWRIN